MLKPAFLDRGDILAMDRAYIDYDPDVPSKKM